MDKKIGMYASIVNLAGVIGFAFSMLIGFNLGSFISCIFIAFGFVPMTCAFCTFRKKNSTTSGYAAMLFGAMYAIIILLVYYAQVTAVRLDHLSEAALRVIDYTSYGLYFSYDLLGYCLMAISTVFAGLTIEAKCRRDKWLKALLLIHGIFAVSCFIIPMLGLFSSDMEGGDFIGIAILEFWCAYFIPIGILSFLYFKKKPRIWQVKPSDTL